MNKLPIFSVLGRAIGFVAGNLLTIVRLSWFPLLLLFAASYFVEKYLMENISGLVSIGTPQDKVGALGDQAFNVLYITWGFLLIQLVITAMVAVALHRIILFGERKPGTLILFSFGKVETLYVLMFIFYIVVIFAVFSIIGFTAALIVGTGSDLAGHIFNIVPNPRDPRSLYIVIAVGLIIFIPIIWFVARTYVLPPAIVATRRFALGDALGLTKGNVWRVIALNVLAVLFLVALGYAIVKVLPYDMVPPQWHLDTYTTGLQPLGTETIRMMQLQQENWILYTAINYVAAILSGAFGVGLMSHSYRALESADGEPQAAREEAA